MGVRGRRSKDDFAARPVVAVPLEPPAGLTAEQLELWHEVVASKPAEWFRADSAPVLEAYVKAVVHYRAMSQRLDRPPKDVDALEKLSRVVAQQARLVAQLAQKMRLTQQSRYTPATAARRDRDTPTVLPWND